MVLSNYYQFWSHSIVGLICLPVTQEITGSNPVETAKFIIYVGVDMSASKEQILKPVCPYCKTEMKPKYFSGYYESFSMWKCLCKRIQRAKVLKGAWA